MECSGSAPSEKSGLTFRSPISAQIGSWSDRTGGAISIAPNTPCRLRIRENHQLFDGKHSWKVSTLFQNLEATQQQVLRHQPCLWGHWLYIAALRLDHGTLLVVATQRDPHAAITDYAHGWGMETLVGMFKSRGFSLEDTHLQDTERLSKLLALLNLALGWAWRSGEWFHQAQPLPIKSHGRRPPSLFRHGLDHLRSIVLNLDCKFEQFLEAVQFLSCT